MVKHFHEKHNFCSHFNILFLLSVSDTQTFKRFGQKFYMSDVFLVEVPHANTVNLTKKLSISKRLPPVAVQVMPLEFEEKELKTIATVDKSLLNVPIHNAPLYIQEILLKNAPVSEGARLRHLYSGPSPLTTHEALEMANKRSTSIKKLTLFQDPGEFMLCYSKENYGSILITISREEAETYHCVSTNGIWEAFYVGKFHVVLSENGQDFIGFLISKVIWNNEI